MTDFIQKLSYKADITSVLADLTYITENFKKWEPDNIIGLRHRPNCADQWIDSSTSTLYDRSTQQFTAVEKDFSQWNDNCPLYTRSLLEELAQLEGISWGRVTFRLSNSKTGLSMHIDKEPRYHLVLQTNQNSIFGECFDNNNVRSICYHIPADGYWYKVDTTREHFIYNGRWTPRIHLVCCPA